MLKFQCINQHYLTFLDTPHRTEIDEIFLSCHPFGQNNDAFKILESLDPSCAAYGQPKQYISFSTGPNTRNKKSKYQVKKSITKEYCVKYLQDNYQENTIVFPPIYQNDNTCLATKLESIFSNTPCFVIHKVNFYKHLQTFGFTEEDIRSKICTNLSNEENCIVVYPPHCRTAVIITLQESKEQSLHQLHLKSNANVRGFLKMHQHFFDCHLHIIGIVGAIFFSKEEIRNISYCTECPKVTILSADDIESEESVKQWWKEMKEEFEEPSFDNEYYSSDSELDKAFGMETNAPKVDNAHLAGLLIVAEAVTDDKFSSYGAKEDEVIKKMILNEPQRKILRDQGKHKIIKGIFYLNLVAIMCLYLYLK